MKALMLTILLVGTSYAQSIKIDLAHGSDRTAAIVGTAILAAAATSLLAESPLRCLASHTTAVTPTT